MDNSKQENQSRFLLAALLCMAVLFGWQYFFAPPPKPAENANTAQVANTQNVPTPQVQATPPPEQTVVAPTDDVPNRQITVKSPLYQVKLDSKGALATSWILVKNARKDKEDVPLWADGSTDQNKIPLELILQDNPNREFPFRLSTGDPNLDALLNDRNYQVSTEGEINLEGNASQQIDFTLRSGDVEVVKSFIFRADSHLTDLQIKATRAGQPIASAKLLIGTAIGDQNIKYHNYYLVEPEAVAYVNNETQREAAYEIFQDSKDPNKGSLAIPGNVDWAGIGDTYFAMAAIPSSPTNGLEFHGTKLEKQVEPFYDGVISWITGSKKSSVTLHRLTAYVPVNLDGSTTKIYTGTKDYFALSEYEKMLPGKNIGELINYSWYSWLRGIQRPVAQFLLFCLDAIYRVVGNFGLAIITFTFIFYSIFFPIRWFQSKQFKKAQANAPKMKEIQDKIKELQKKGVPMDDPRMRQLQMEQLKLTKDAIPIMGCLPMLLQIPLFVAFYTAITIGMDFRQTSFLWLPDLSLADPYHILEFLFAGSMAGAMVLTPTAPAITDEQKAQQKMMMYFMPVMMLWLMWGYPAGLLLYWFFGNIVSFGQQMIINRFNKTNDPPKEEIVDTVPKSAKKVKPKLSTS